MTKSTKYPETTNKTWYVEQMKRFIQGEAETHGLARVDVHRILILGAGLTDEMKEVLANVPRDFLT